jgi:hypothetical protein
MNATFSVRRWVRAVSAAAIGLMLVAAMQQSSRAAVILVFSQVGTGNTFFGTNDGLGTAGSTKLSATDVAVTISGYAGGGTPISAFFNLAATSTAVATTVGTDVSQRFSGTFSLTSLSGGGGTNYLSGDFSDRVFGSGSGLVLSASTPADSVNFNSSVLSSSQLQIPRAISLSFTNVTPQITISNNSLASFSSSVSGNFSATAAVPEPTALALWTVIGGLSSVLGWRAKRRS